MKQSHRSEQLDKLIGCTVSITLVDGMTLEGKLGWKGYRGDFMRQCNTYYLKYWTPAGYKYLPFRKAHIRRIEEL